MLVQVARLFLVLFYKFGLYARLFKYIAQIETDAADAHYQCIFRGFRVFDKYEEEGTYVSLIGSYENCLPLPHYAAEQHS